MRRAIQAVVVLAGLSLAAPPAGAQGGAAQGGNAIYVNDTPFTEQHVRALQTRLGVPNAAPLPPGRYWYDDASGLWGLMGGPALGQILPGLELGGRLRADASGGFTTVFVNGRALHPLEVQYLHQLFGVVYPGRYWLNWQGVGGYEGGPPQFDLRAAAAAAGGASGGYGGYTARTPFGGLGGDGNCSYYLHPDGPSVMNC